MPTVSKLEMVGILTFLILLSRKIQTRIICGAIQCKFREIRGFLLNSQFDVGFTLTCLVIGVKDNYFETEILWIDGLF